MSIDPLGIVKGQDVGGTEFNDAADRVARCLAAFPDLPGDLVYRCFRMVFGDPKPVFSEADVQAAYDETVATVYGLKWAQLQRSIQENYIAVVRAVLEKRKP